MTLTMGSGEGLPSGAYQGVFEGIESIENEMGPCLKWKWRITSGEHKGKIASRITGVSPTLKNACGKMLGQLAGRPLVTGESFVPSKCVGKPYMVIVAPGEKGGTRVETVAPAPQQ